ncbi:hypothetical protein CVT25_015640 [Psilocybe cyanescens]|uniref:Uncharacterized protein n=1 Tax=Psilocybe cyanescens TaxID=93625 RepID=A0A409WHV1_PSICY|nr:hypothetical protein CVT25_015640 [Psilocybe cyanescens]
MGRTAQDFETHGVQNIRRYLRSFTIPEPPPCSYHDMINLPPVTAKSKSHQNQALQVQPENYRCLENMRPIAQDKEALIHWLDKNMPDSKDVKGKKVTMYQLPDKLSDRFFTHRMCDIYHMESWLTLPLVTLFHVLHYTMPEATNWGLHLGEAHHTLFRYQVWRPEKVTEAQIEPAKVQEEEKEKTAPPCPVVIAYQTPYVLSPSDFQEFVDCRSFPCFIRGAAKNAPYSGKHKLWATLWDTCRVEDAQWFFLTTYTHWVVGHFTSSGRIAFVSQIFHFQNRSPTLLEWLTYWMSSAMKYGDTYNLPKVYEPISEELDFEMGADLPPLPRARSESYWPGRDDEPGTQAILDYIHEEWEEEAALTAGGNTIGLPPRNNLDMTRPDIVKWMASCRQPTHRKLDQDDLDCPIGLDAEWAEHEMFEPGAPRGEWMIST